MAQTASLPLTSSARDRRARALDDEAPPAVYHAVPLWRFALFNLITGGFYVLYWSYSCWLGIEQRDGAPRQPAVRAFFTGISNFFLVADLERRAPSRSAWARAILWASPVAYVVALGLAPDRGWGLLVLPFAPWLLLPLVHAMRARTSPGALARLDRAKPEHVLWFVLGLPVWALWISLIRAPYVDAAQPPPVPLRIGEAFPELVR